jgi:HPt (histidine-containing phosphotransfer) domain-containing protein
MGSIRHRQRGGAAAGCAPSAETSDKFASMLYARLLSERVHFATLSAALARTDESPAPIFDDLHHRAHRLKGAAATFDFAALAAAAAALEKAAIAARARDAAHTDDEIWTALVALVQLLGDPRLVRIPV